MATNDPKAVAAQQRDIANLLQRQLDVAEQINNAYDVTLTKVSAIATAVKSIGIEDIEQALVLSRSAREQPVAPCWASAWRLKQSLPPLKGSIASLRA
jgi:hypothetical protein